MLETQRIFPIKVLTALLFVSASWIFFSCEEDISWEQPYVHVKILQPKDSAVVRDTILTIEAELTKNCGCQVRAEFWIDGVHVASDFLSPYIYGWDIRGVTGLHTIRVRGVVEKTAEHSDSVRVIVNPT
ncbi:MAG: Ig-like domain-containing protein [Bacteroidota bacterium]|nr:Ig-like domain-containing protein [Bacteroidota bacterium]